MARGPDPDVSDVDILEFMIRHPTPAFIAREVAQHFDINEQTARNRLNQMVGKDLMYRKKPGENTVFYWPSDAGRELYASDFDDL